MSLIPRLEAYLAAQVGSPVQVSNFGRKSGGASRETYLFDATWQDGTAERTRGYVLRRDPVASLLESDRTHELRVLESAARIGVPVPWVTTLGVTW